MDAESLDRSITIARDPISVRCDDGWVLRGERVTGMNARAVALCGHAMMVDRRTLDRPRGDGLASRLAALGFEAWVFDSRGHGESTPRAEQGGRWSYDDIVRLDVPAMLAAARRAAGGRRVALFGHSLVGHAALIAAGLDPRGAPDAIVAYAPNLWSPRSEPRLGVRFAKAAALHAWHGASAVRGFFDARAYGVGTDGEALPYIEQFVRMWRRGRLESPDGEVD